MEKQKRKSKLKFIMRYFVLFSMIRVIKASAYNQTIGWCKLNEADAYDGYTQYNMKTHSCVQCGGEYSLHPRKDMKTMKCCPDGTLKARCNEEDKACQDGGYYSGAVCDGHKECVDGSDENVCPQCSADQFLCSDGNGTFEEQCIESHRVCDGVKDCFSGLDETNCTYFGGRCDGYLCTEYKQCLPLDVICNGTKECMDGSDETMCQWSGKGNFQCESAETPQNVLMYYVCDGESDCNSLEDERNCFTWSEWSPWSGCGCMKGQSSTEVLERTRSCVTMHSNVNTDGKCNGANTQHRNATCDCVPPTSGYVDTNLPMKIIIPLMTVLVVIVILFIVHMIMQRKKAWVSYSEAVVSFSNGGNGNATHSPTGHLLELTEGLGVTSTSGQFEDRKLPATPSSYQEDNENLFHSPHTYSSVKFKGRLSIHDDSDDLGSPSNQGTPYSEMVRNPLYHSYVDSPTPYHSMDGDGAYRKGTRSQGSCSPRLTSSIPNLTDREYPDVFHNEDGHETRSTLMEQIEIAQMGNLIEVSDIKLN